MSDREALIRALVAGFQTNRVVARGRGNAGTGEWDVATLSEAHRLAEVALTVLHAEGFDPEGAPS